MTPEDKLLEMLTWMRPHDSAIERTFCEKYIATPYKDHVVLMGPMLNLAITVGENSKTLFSCHTDTVHRTPGMQTVIYDPTMAMAYKNDAECLGADDTTGVWLMLEMIEAEVPGTYIFHRGEECGGLGSRWLSYEEENWLMQFDRAIAFDRKGESSVITKQRGSTCCSSEFAMALATQLGKEWLEDPTGSFTDTANYTHLIPECTNLSVGYYDQHSSEEMQNTGFAMALRELCINTVDWEHLPTVREAKEEPIYIWNKNPWAAQQSQFDYADPYGMDDYESASDAELAALSLDELEEICRGDPYFAASKLYGLLQQKPASPQHSEIDSIIERLDEFEMALAGFEEEAMNFEERLTALEEPTEAPAPKATQAVINFLKRSSH